jgi:hypothetical protein
LTFDSFILVLSDLQTTNTERGVKTPKIENSDEEMTWKEKDSHATWRDTRRRETVTKQHSKVSDDDAFYSLSLNAQIFSSNAIQTHAMHPLN